MLYCPLLPKNAYKQQEASKGIATNLLFLKYVVHQLNSSDFQLKQYANEINIYAKTEKPPLLTKPFSKVFISTRLTNPNKYRDYFWENQSKTNK